MYKLVLNDGTTYDIVEPASQTTVQYNGVETDAVSFTLVDPDLVLKTIKAAFQDDFATSDMSVKFPDGTLAARYTNYSKLARIGINEADQFFIVMALTSDIPTMLASVQKLVKAQESVINEIKKDLTSLDQSLKETGETVSTTVSEYKETVNTELDKIQENIQNLQTGLGEIAGDKYDPETATLEEVKKMQITMSKYNLKCYLEENPIYSSVHGGVSKPYSITAEKQQYLAQMIMLAEGYNKLSEIMKQRAEEADTTTGITGDVQTNAAEEMNSLGDFHISWNAVGEPCTYDWTLEELYLLSAEIEQVVRPLISKQQQMEAAINRAISKSDVNSISISFP